MSADGSQPEHAGWTKAGTYSVWAYDRAGQGDGRPILLVAQEWEIAGIRGIHVVGIWSPFTPFSTREQEEKDATELRVDLEMFGQEENGSFHFAQLVEAGHLKYVGPMPAIGKYIASPTVDSP